MLCSTRLILSLAVLAAAGVPNLASADDTDALSLQGSAEAASQDRGYRLFVEGVLGTIQQRGGLGSRSTQRLSIDYTQSVRTGADWRLNLSNRLDYLQPPGVGLPRTLNSLREAYATWRPEGGEFSLELGRLNVRNGPAYGYNPTDFFRDGAVRASTTVDPFALRENRLGTAMIRAQRLWAGGGVSLSLVPKLADRPSNASFSADLGATNSRDKALGVVSFQISDRFSAQGLLFTERDRGAQVGASMTALLSDASVAHLEWARGRDEDTWARVTAGQSLRASRSRLSAGLTLAVASQLSVTAEFEYNGFAPDQADWRRIAASTPVNLGLYALEAQRRQDNAARNSWLLYATQKGIFIKNLDATALVRFNSDDHSRLGWLEVRHHWQGLDGALQWQWSQGGALTQYGLIPVRQSLQLLIAAYF